MKRVLRLLPFYAELKRNRAAVSQLKRELKTRSRQAADQAWQIEILERITRRLLDERGFPPLPPPELRTHVGRVADPANFWGQGLASSTRVIQLFGEAPGGPVLDWGCGSGRTLAWLRGVGTWNENYRGCDVDAEAIHWLKSQGVEQVALCGDRPPLPYPDGSFAGLFCFSVLTHIPPPEHAGWYREMHRLLRPGGRAYITVHGDQNMLSGKSFTEEERRDYFARGWSFSEREGHYKHAATVTKAFTLEALGEGFELERHRERGYHSMDELVVRRL